MTAEKQPTFEDPSVHVAAWEAADAVIRALDQGILSREGRRFGMARAFSDLIRSAIEAGAGAPWTDCAVSHDRECSNLKRCAARVGVLEREASKLKAALEAERSRAEAEKVRADKAEMEASLFRDKAAMLDLIAPGSEYVPRAELDKAEARCKELEAHIQARLAPNDCLEHMDRVTELESELATAKALYQTNRATLGEALARLTAAERDAKAAYDIAGNALGTDPSLRNIGCVRALADAWKARVSECATLREQYAAECALSRKLLGAEERSQEIIRAAYANGRESVRAFSADGRSGSAEEWRTWCEEAERECKTLHTIARGTPIDPTTIVLHGRTEREWNAIGALMNLYGLSDAVALEKHLCARRALVACYDQAAKDRDALRSQLAASLAAHTTVAARLAQHTVIVRDLVVEREGLLKDIEERKRVATAQDLMIQGIEGKRRECEEECKALRKGKA